MKNYKLSNSALGLLDDGQQRSFFHWIASVQNNKSRANWNELKTYLESRFRPESEYLTTLLQIYDIKQNTPMHQAVLLKNEEYCKWLASKRINFTRQNEDGSTSLHLAVRDRSTEMTKILLGTKNIEDALWIVDNDGRTPMHIAAMNDDAYTAELLFQKLPSKSDQQKLIFGQPENDEQKKLRSAYQLAISSETQTVLKYFINKSNNIQDLKQFNVYGSPALHASLSFSNLDVFHLSLEKFGSKISDSFMVDKKGRNILHLTAKYGNSKAYDEIVAKIPGDIVSLTYAKEPHNQYTPLHYAAKFGHDLVLQKLADTFADGENMINPVTSDESVSTPLHLAASNCQQFPKHHKAVFEILVQHGADLEALNSDDDKPLKICQSNKCSCVALVSRKVTSSFLFVFFFFR
jgi:ankyrin repeat protein